MLEMKLFILLIMKFTEIVKWGKFEKLLLFKCKLFLLHNWKFVVVTSWNENSLAHHSNFAYSKSEFREFSV